MSSNGEKFALELAEQVRATDKTLACSAHSQAAAAATALSRHSSASLFKRIRTRGWVVGSGGRLGKAGHSALTTHQ